MTTKTTIIVYRIVAQQSEYQTSARVRHPHLLPASSTLFVMDRIMGIDPGFRITGYGIVDLVDDAIEPVLFEAGIFSLNTDLSAEQRLEQLYRELGGVLDDRRPDRMVVEQLYSHYRHPRTSILMAHARGVILLCAQQRGIAIEHLSATEVKKALTGFGHATKRQMQIAVQGQCHLPAPPSPPDVADAIAIALTLGRRMAVQRL